jgi:hypothetical protein
MWTTKEVDTVKEHLQLKLVLLRKMQSTSLYW